MRLFVEWMQPVVEYFSALSQHQDLCRIPLSKLPGIGPAFTTLSGAVDANRRAEIDSQLMEWLRCEWPTRLVDAVSHVLGEADWV